MHPCHTRAPTHRRPADCAADALPRWQVRGPRKLVAVLDGAGAGRDRAALRARGRERPAEARASDLPVGPGLAAQVPRVSRPPVQQGDGPLARRHDGAPA
eukprot:1777397-Prymnesium_polylepis.1